MNGWKARIDQALQQALSQNQKRQRVVCEIKPQSEMMVAGRSYLNFSSNDYLGLSQHPDLLQIAMEAMREHGIGSGGSGHVTGYSAPLASLEQDLATWLGYERAIVYPSGFTANQAIIKLLIAKGDRILADKLSHASIMEAAMLSLGELRRFKHNDPTSLQKLLSQSLLSEDAEQIVITEGVFSMDGDMAPLDALVNVIQDQALFMVDDAHGIGILGNQGRGTCDHFGIHPDILVVTFGKAAGCSGAAILLSAQLAEYFIQSSRPLIYSTAIPPMQAAILRASFTLIRGQIGDALRQKLRKNIHYFQNRMKDLLSEIPESHRLKSSLQLLPSDTPIQPLIIGESDDALKVADSLKQQGIWLSAIRPPTVPPKSARLRITITATHTAAMIDQLIAAFHQVLFDAEYL
ncbi:8-amino-7-oxononanoate synthase [Ignatzschineria ureiclastica]|uniref:8-amino-7-oxononanoate synthase n=1 Tax=Ignatzschineria ureiclastica TaxID=472582 RepID=A0A2U2AE31_9GAMM|nr:8-amino-7-oxononanoate synthase [Ignatzschineria ureiclastica]PWD80877.1 8-amino-7-oxononanoate synthase [Ignatzschineria ureiclastica]GGZ94183.1 8-amino-7-oxononanoate synthase [Ignatzschineria ureiclastica]